MKARTTQSGLHRRNANLRVRQLLELASELAVLYVPAQGGEWPTSPLN